MKIYIRSTIYSKIGKGLSWSFLESVNQLDFAGQILPGCLYVCFFHVIGLCLPFDVMFSGLWVLDSAGLCRLQVVVFLF